MRNRGFFYSLSPSLYRLGLTDFFRESLSAKINRRIATSGPLGRWMAGRSDRMLGSRSITALCAGMLLTGKNRFYI